MRIKADDERDEKMNVVIRRTKRVMQFYDINER